MLRRLLIADLDNTLYNFVDYYAPCFRGMVHALSKKTLISEDQIIQEFKEVYAKHGSLEYGFAVQELTSVRGKPSDEIWDLIRVAKGAFSRVRQKNLVTYPNVKETLLWMNQQGITVIGVSNAPAFHALRRLQQLHIDQFFTALVCWEGNFYEENDHSKDILEKERLGLYKTKVKKVWKLPREKLKPSTAGYLMVLDDLKIASSNCYVVGDSISKDVHPAESIGANGIWARYGEKIQQKNLDTVLKISNWDQKKKDTIYFIKHEEPRLVIDDFSDLKKILTPSQFSFDF